jgi:3-hydroxyisobutyrate dehydrogenase
LRYGFIGLGHLGSHLAASLLREGFDLTVHDLNQEAARSLVERGARWAQSPKDLATAVDVVITCLPSTDCALAVSGSR